MTAEQDSTYKKYLYKKNVRTARAKATGIWHRSR